MPFSTIFQLPRGSHWWREPEYPDENIDLLHITDKLDQIMS